MSAETGAREIQPETQDVAQVTEIIIRRYGPDDFRLVDLGELQEVSRFRDYMTAYWCCQDDTKRRERFRKMETNMRGNRHHAAGGVT